MFELGPFMYHAVRGSCTMRFMRPVSVFKDVPVERGAVYAFLGVMADHELFTDHMMRDWTCSGPAAGWERRLA